MKLVSRGARSALALVVAVTVLTAASPASADGDAPKMDNRARAQQLFDSALADAEAGNLPSACPKFLASHEADPKASTLLNLASCYEKNGQTASAWGAFREAEVLARKVGRADWETNARTHAEMLEPKLVKLTVQVPQPSRVPDLVVMRDGARIAAGEWGVAIPVDPGEHVVSASAPGRTPWESRTAVREASATATVPVLELVAAPAPVVPAPVPGGDGTPRDVAPPSSWWTPMRTTGVVVAGVGVVGLVTGTVLGLVAKGKYDDARARCADGSRACPPGAVADADSAFGMATGATVVFVIGAAAAVGGGALVLFSPSPSSSSPTSASAALVVGPGTVGVNGRW
jgi:hypothetical protein